MDPVGALVRLADPGSPGPTGGGPLSEGCRPILVSLTALAVLAASGLSACGPSDGGAGGEEAARNRVDGRSGSGPAAGLSGTVLPEPRPKGDFTLTATDGEPYRFAEETDGYLTVVFFGYTHCPDVCPVTMANLGAAVDRVPPAVEEEVKVVFVSTDPARDSLARIRSWLDRFDPSFVGLRGPLEEVNRIMNSYGLPGAMKEQPGKEEGYTVGHSGHVLVFSPEGPLRAIYSARTRQREWVRDLSRLVTEGFPEAAAEPEAAMGARPPADEGGTG